MKKISKILLSFLVIFLFAFTFACKDDEPDAPIEKPDEKTDVVDNNGNQDNHGSQDNQGNNDDHGNNGEQGNQDGQDNQDDQGNQGNDPEPIVVPRFKEDYTPKLFTFVSYTEEEITDGVILYTYTITKANGDTTIIREVEVDLEKATIKAGTNGNQSIGFNYTKTTPYAAGENYSNITGKDVYATLNADFFGSTCVNAFVKDGFIVKASHNDNDNYDYLNTSSDVPASAPMLFGISGTKAQVAPIINYDGDITSPQVKKTLIRASLNYTITAGIRSFDTSNSFKLINTTLYLNPNDMYVIVDLKNGASDVEVLEINMADKKMTLEPLTGKKAYLYCSASNEDAISFLTRIAVGQKLQFSVKSPDGLWDGYDTILGCRQALVIDGKIADTVKLENTNGAQSGDVPRSAVGVNTSGKVCIYAVESMYYGRKNNDGDPHGCDLNVLAEFMMYNNVENGANFDGGGSTQLICKLNGADTVVVRSSDTGSADLTSTRQVMNVIMVVEK